MLRPTVDRRLGNLAAVAELNRIPIPQRWEYAYDLASAFAVRGDREHAYQWLFRAVTAGYPAHNAFDDPLTEGMRDDPACRALMQQARLRIESS
jgi:hypothetical protein